jgi:preprotein translocase SecE subunit
MAKTRAQRKAERRKRQQQLERQRKAGAPDGGGGRDAEERVQEERAQEDTQHGVSGEVAEAEAVMRTGARPEEYGEHTVDQGDGAPGPKGAAGVAEPEAPAEPQAPAPSRADVGQPAEVAAPERESRRARRKREKEERRQARAREQRRAEGEKAEKRRGPVLGFLASCWAELKRVQWPDRDTLVQASAVTLIFVALMGAYLGLLDAAFNWLVKQII